MNPQAAADKIRGAAKIHGWRFCDPGPTVWRSVYERYRKGSMLVAVRYDQRGAVLCAHLIGPNDCMAEVQPGDKRKMSTVAGWFGNPRADELKL